MQILRTRSDFHTTLEKSFNEIDIKWKGYTGVVVVGSHQPANVEKKIEQIRWARENKVPYLGICFGMQLMLIEFARNVLGLQGADTEELDQNAVDPIITKLPELRVGIYPVKLENRETMESHWHNYAFNRKYKNDFLQHNWYISYTGDVAELAILRTHPYFMGIQFHPEYQSSKYKPHPILKEFLQQCKNFTAGKLQA